jgi:hypothetical protein
MFPQPPSGMEGLYGHQPGVLKRSWVSHSEESHTINVFAPEGTKADDNLPVMVWIYGGSLNNGSADRFLYDPTEWVRESAKRGEKFIVVTGNYRTNIFGESHSASEERGSTDEVRVGFFSGPDVVAADKDGSSGNYGLYDCVKMLQWVRLIPSIPRWKRTDEMCAGPIQYRLVRRQSWQDDHFWRERWSLPDLSLDGQWPATLPACDLAEWSSQYHGTSPWLDFDPSTDEFDSQTLRPSATSYPAYSTIITQHTAAATPSARISSLRTLPFEQLLQAHNDAYRWGGVGLTLEEGPKAIWSKDTLERLQNGEWDEWIEGVVLGTNEDEGSLFTFGMKVGLLSQFPLLRCKNDTDDESTQLHTEAAFRAYVSSLNPSIQPAVLAKYLPTPHPPPTSSPDYINAPASRVLADQIFVDPAFEHASLLSEVPHHASGKKLSVWKYRCRAQVDRISKGPVKTGVMYVPTPPLSPFFSLTRETVVGTLWRLRSCSISTRCGTQVLTKRDLQRL